MPKQKLFDDDSEEEVTLKTENEYAKKYDTWREKEEIHKLEQKYGTKALNSDASLSSDSEDEDDEPPEIPEEVEEQFLKTLSLLKAKDPKIYDPKYKFFEEKQKEEVKEDKKKTLTFADSDEDDDDDGNIFSIEKKAEIIEEKKPETVNSGPSKEGKLKAYLTGAVEHIDEPVERDLAPLKALWSDPTLNEGEAFLRDYILNKRYLDPDEGGADDKLRDDAELEADEATVEEQGKFERAYNFRFEEPDQEYLKRFPRTMNTVRPKDERRARKRAEVRTRKEQEKQRKMEEIARLKALKLKEIQEKIAKIKEVTGNDELAFKEEDIEGEFDPEEHDRRMKAIFDEQFYGQQDDEKPVFPDLDEELEIEKWEDYEPDTTEVTAGSEDGPHCEHAEFNMDADYDPKVVRANLLQQIQATLGKKRRNRKNKSKLAKLLAKDKPKYIPNEIDKTYAEYMEEYYSMDCEDVIAGEIPTRFKYREVVPNDYGLTVEEILLADDKELTQWVPLKKLVRHKPESAQKSEVAAYRQKAQDLALKKKVLPSLFKELPEEPELVVPKEAAQGQKKKKKNKKKNKSKNTTGSADAAKEEQNEPVFNENEESKDTPNDNKKKKNKEMNDTENITENNEHSIDENTSQNTETPSEGKKKKHKNKLVTNESLVQETSAISIENNKSEDTAKRKKKNKNKHSETNLKANNESSTSNGLDTTYTEKQNGEVSSKKKKNKGFEVETVVNATPSQESTNNLKRKLDYTGNNQVPNKKKKNKNKNNPYAQNAQGKKNNDFKKLNKEKFKNNKDEKSSDPLSKLSDERLKAYGLNPKKYKNFLKYKKF